MLLKNSMVTENAFQTREKDKFDTFFSSLSSWGVLVPLELLPLRLEFGVSSPSGVRLRGEGGDGSLDSEEN